LLKFGKRLGCVTVCHTTRCNMLRTWRQRECFLSPQRHGEEHSGNTEA
jgi:hypothetical protein